MKAPVRVPTTLPDLEKWKWIFDPVPDWLLKDEIRWKEYSQLMARFSAKQIELEQQALALEKERIAAVSAFYSK